MDSPLGYISVYEMLFIFLITFLVVGPRRVIRGFRVIREWIQTKFSRLRNGATAKTTELAKKARAAKSAQPAQKAQTTQKAQPAKKTKTSSKTQNVMRGLGRMAGYYRDLGKDKKKE